MIEAAPLLQDKDEEGSVDQAVSRNRGISEIEEGLSSIVMSFDKGNDIRTMGSQVGMGLSGAGCV